MVSSLDVGQTAPDFTLPDQDDRLVNLSDFRGRWVVLYFYPQDDTPGCTLEARQFTELHEQFDLLGATVVGISSDPSESHRAFIEKHSLAVTLLSDCHHEVSRTYCAWGLKQRDGRQMLGVIRSTVLVDPDGRIAFRWPYVKAEGHADEVRQKLVELQGAHI